MIKKVQWYKRVYRKKRGLEVIIKQLADGTRSYPCEIWSIKKCIWFGFKIYLTKTRFISSYKFKFFIAKQIGLKGRAQGSMPASDRHFRPAVNKGLNCLWPVYFLTQANEIFLNPKEKNWKIGVLGRNLADPELAYPTHPKHQKIKLIWPGSKFFDQDPSLVWTHNSPNSQPDAKAIIKKVKVFKSKI